MSITWSAVASDKKVIADIDLSDAFSTISPWRFYASQEPSAPLGDYPDEPGEIELCLRKVSSNACDPQLKGRFDTKYDLYARPRYLNKAQIVQGVSDQTYLWIKTSSLGSADGDQYVLAQALMYRRGSDEFVRVYAHQTGSNNNQDIRFIETSVLKGYVISVEPTSNAPFSYWVSVNAPAADGMYKEILRYRSATTYNDGNPLSVVDSEMVNIQKRLGLWRPGMPLPLPEQGCAKPRLVRMALWCT
jgi:hypothetical protein